MLGPETAATEDATEGERPPIRIEFRRPALYRKQREAIFGDEQLGLIEASTKTGKTTGCIVWLLERAFLGGGNGRNYWWVAPISGQADIAFTRSIRMLPPGSFTANRSKPPRIILPNGAVVWFHSGDKADSLYGEDVYAAVIDEASRFKAEAWHAIRTTLTYTRGPARIIGNVKGRRNWFFALARRAEAGAPGMAYHKLIAHDAVQAGILSTMDVERAKADLPERWFRELYLAEPSDDAGNPFGLDALARCVRPMSIKPAVAWGWDLAKHEDWTVGIGLDATGTVCQFHRFQRDWQTTIPLILSSTNAFAMVDSTGVGDPILEALQKAKPGLFEGYHFTSPSKQRLMEGLTMAVHQGKIGVPPKIEAPEPNHPANIMLELEQFEYEYRSSGVRYTAPEGMHDDTVCALALAVACTASIARREPPRVIVKSY